MRRPGLTLGASLLLAIPLLWQLPRLAIHSETRVLLEGDQRNLASYDKVQRILSGLEVVVIDVECAEIFSREGIEVVRRVSEAFSHQAGVDDVKSLTHSVKPVRRGLSFDMIPLVPEGADPAELARLRRYCLEHPLIRNVLASSDGRHALITVTYRADLSGAGSQQALRNQVDGVLAPFRAEGLQFRLLALPLVGEEIRSTLRGDLWKFLPMTLALVLVVLWGTFRSGVVIVLVIVNQLMVLLLMPGLILTLGLSVNLFSVMLFPLLAGIQLEQLAHLFMEAQRQRALGREPAAAVAEAARSVDKGCAFALITTAVGLLSLLSGDVQQIRDFGLLGALGIGLIYLVTFGPGLSLLVCCARWFDIAAPEVAGADDRLTRAMRRLGRWTVRARGAIVLVTAAVVGFAALGWAQVRTDIRAVEFLHPSSPTRQAVEALDRIYGGVNVVQIEIDAGSAKGVNRMEFLRYLERVQRFAESRPGISGAYSYAQLLAMINQIWEGDRPEALRLPSNALMVNFFVAALQAQNYPFLAALADAEQRVAYLVLRTRDMPSEQYLGIVDEVTDYARRTKLPEVQVSAAAGIHSILEADRRVIRSQTRSAGLTAAVIAIILAVLWRSPVLALASLFANAVPTALVIAAAGYLNIPLNSVTIMVAAISLGIAVDNSIHFITRWREEMRVDGQLEQALDRCLAAKVRPMAWSSAVLFGICPVFWCSSFPPIVHFGLLSALSFVAAMLATLVLLPALLSWVPHPAKRTD